ncbi:hypothetical protein [Nonomuraea sp. NPDC048916]|uniref:hypothetical protein n=1 Tax=Nonomuraea sp. NPDC048916 TaxID=3154232 RepID=UPI0033D28AAE
MAVEEKSAWIMAVVSVVAYTAYLVVVLGRAGGGPLVEVPYASPLLWSVGGAIVAGIVLNIVAGGAVPKGARRKDQRDREINQFGEFVGQSFTVIGGVTALGMALAEFAYFWIANVIYLGFVLSAILGSIAKIVAYRKGFHPW